MIARLTAGFCLAVAMTQICQVRAQSNVGLQRFKSETYGFAAQYPPIWQMNPYSPRKGILEIINFPPATAANAVFLPRGGASITLEPIQAVQGPLEPRSSMRRQIPHTLKEWIDISNEHRKTLATRTLVRGNLHIIEIDAEYTTGSQAVDWFFEYRTRLFRATLVFWRADDHSEELLPVLEQVVLSLKLDTE